MPPKIGGEYGPITVKQESNYDAADSKFENGESESDLDTELQDLSSSPPAGVAVPSSSALSQAASATATAVQTAQTNFTQTQQMHTVMATHDNNNAATGHGGPIAGDLAARTSCREGCTLCMSYGVSLGKVAVIGAAIFLLVELGLYLNGSDNIYGKKKAAAQSGAAGGGGGAHQMARVPGMAPAMPAPAQAAAPAADPVGDQLALWAGFPEDSWWKLLGLRATLKGHEWSLSKWCYVTGYLSRIASNLSGRDTNAAFTAALVSDTKIDADYAVWGKASFDPMTIFATSASYPAASSGLTGIDERAVRLDYLARIHDKHIRNWIADQ